MKNIYICSPLGASTQFEIKENMNKAQDYSDRVKKLCEKSGLGMVNVYAPHAVLPKFLNDNNYEERNAALYVGKKILAACDTLIICGKKISEGMKSEIDYAKAHKIQVTTLEEFETFLWRNRIFTYVWSIFRSCGAKCDEDKINAITQYCMDDMEKYPSLPEILSKRDENFNGFVMQTIFDTYKN